MWVLQCEVQVCQCGAPLQFAEQPTPTPAGTEVLMKVLAAGVCHSDLHIADGYFDLGGGKAHHRGARHQAAAHHGARERRRGGGGRPQAQGVRVGDRRLAHPWMLRRVRRLPARRRAALPHAVEPRRVPRRRLQRFSVGAHPRYLFDIGDLPPEKAAPLACSGVTTYGALKKVGAVLKSEPLVIIGAGGLGLMCLALHKAMGGHSAIVVDIDPVKRAAAKTAGARQVIDGGARDAAQQIVAATNGGAWAAIDLVGSSGTARLAIDSLIKGGKLIVVGLYGGDITVPLPFFPMRAITLQGSYVGSLTEMAELLDLVRSVGLPPIPVATRPLAEVNAALDDLRAGKVVGRVVLTPASGRR